ncbi:LPXTG cell wall surface protein [Streptococcus anginosus C238]|nr:LPXTG cell wall surface protein [Streptococcus anginosus C238]
MSLLLAVTMLISMASLNVSASETDKIYKAYDASQHRKVISQNGTTDSEWSLCMTSTKQSPGTSTEATGEYSKNENATKDTYTHNGGKGDFQKIKRMLFYKLKHPELNYTVLQNEYYYQQGDEANKRQYDTNYSQYPQLNQEKQELRAFAEDSSHDDEINSKMEVFIYKAKNQLMQNLISAKLKELPPPPSTPSTKVKFSKKALTENGEELKGATIRLTKEDGSLVKEWVTDGTVKEFELKDGKYTFTEISAPDKYQVATAITFEVKNGKVIVKGIEVTGNTIVMVDKLRELPPPPPSTPSTKVKFSKKALTENGEELKGATIRLTKEDGSLVKEWVTDGTVKEFELKDGKYTFTEISAPDKYQVATAITFEVKNGKVIVKGIEVTGNTIVMVDKLRELPPPPPSTPSTKVKFSKKALTENGEELKGATIRLTKEDGSLVKEWVTDGTVKEFELKDGKYTFTEISAPDKYQVATAITFEVKNGKVIVKGIEVTGNTIVMVDKLKELPPPPPSTPSTKVKFSKKALTENGEELKGATIRLTKEDGSLVKEWVTDGTVKEFELKDGKYTFTEISAPAKYQVATAITFEVKNGKVIVKGIEVTGNTIVMVDKLKELPSPNTNTNKTLPKTGEGTNISLYAWLMLTSGTLLVLIGYRRRNHAK